MGYLPPSDTYPWDTYPWTPTPGHLPLGPPPRKDLGPKMLPPPRRDQGPEIPPPFVDTTTDRRL